MMTARTTIMTLTPRSTRSLLILWSIIILGCSDGIGINQLVLVEGETKGGPSCTLLTDDGSRSTGGDVGAFDSDDDYQQHQTAGGGKAKFSFFIRPEPGEEHTGQLYGRGPEVQLGELALEFEVDLDKFAHDARLDHFETRDGVEHEVYTWASADCEKVQRSVPDWVLEKVAAP